MASYLAAVHPEDQLSEETMTSTVNYMFKIFCEFVNGVTGLSIGRAKTYCIPYDKQSNRLAKPIYDDYKRYERFSTKLEVINLVELEKNILSLLWAIWAKLFFLKTSIQPRQFLDPLIEEFRSLTGMKVEGLSQKSFVPSDGNKGSRPRGRPKGVKNRVRSVKVKVQSPDLTIGCLVHFLNAS
ncbi:hypothetical protein Tco_1411236 [Tanacetum coccineum]